MSQKALEHVLYGELTDKVFNTDNGRIAKKVIAGGLHTYVGWLAYLKKSPGLRTVSHFYSEKDEGWFYERELQNGTILLKLPESVFTTRAAKMTMFPENNYKSGYLWKTLFPKDFGSEQILDLLHDALKHISKPESREGEIICYYKLDEPLKCLRISVLYRNSEINSFYPTWSQPNTGNNGKPFSFFDNIGHVNSESTWINDDEQFNMAEVGLLSELSDFLDLPDITPKLFLDRSANFSNLGEWESSRIKELQAYAEKCDINKITEIYNYVNDAAIYKYHDKVSQFTYNNYLSYIKLSEQFYNATCMNQNLVEGIYVLFLFDQKYKSKLYADTALKLTSNMFTSPLVDMWAKKRIHYTIATLTLYYHDQNFPAEYFDCMATSPSRREFYSEYFFESHDKKTFYNNVKTTDDIENLFGIVICPPQDKPITYSNFIHYFSDNLGESYSLHFSDDARKDFLLSFYSEEYYSSYVKDVLKFFSQKVFTPSATYICDYLEHFSKDGNAKPEKIYKIIYEYFKIQVAQRYRINLNYAKYHDVAEIVTLPIKKDEVYSVILKHERWANRFWTDKIMESVTEYLSKVENIQLEKVLKIIEENNRKETPRFPIPYNLITKMVKNPESLDMDELKIMKILEENQ
ncbi:hypothetical protein [Yersinia intermedia]|uniref:hypothetical protein n=1 Tax=Yersinia intermedia TaxID=631 RepID=UPI0030D4E8D0